MINLIFRGGAGGHTISALLDYCTEEGGLEGFPVMIPGDNLHSHRIAHAQIQTKFYRDFLHNVGDEIMYKKIGSQYLSPSKLIDYNITDEKTLAPIATDDFGKMLIFSMSIGKVYSKVLPPDDDIINYSTCGSLADRIERAAMTHLDQLNTSFDGFHNHKQPTYALDINWFWTSPESIIQVILDCGWHPKNEKVFEFCKLVQKFNEKYFSAIDNAFSIYRDVVKGIDRPCQLTTYESIVVYALLLRHYNCSEFKDIGLLERPPIKTLDLLNYINRA